MTITEFINKLKEWASDIGPEDEVEITPYRLLTVYDSEYIKEFAKFIMIFYKGTN
jgi:hypothetical protein